MFGYCSFLCVPSQRLQFSLSLPDTQFGSYSNDQTWELMAVYSGGSGIRLDKMRAENEVTSETIKINTRK